MTNTKRGLGRGLDALIPASHRPAPVEGGEPPTPTPIPRRGPEQLDIDLIAPNPEQPRTHFDPDQLRELADSIRVHGILQPLVVSRSEAGGYRLVAGERRLQAARLAGLSAVPVVVRDTQPDELLELALIENIQRADLNPVEEALAYRRLVDEHHLTQEEAARRVGKSRVAVANSLRLLGLEPEVRRSLASGEISEGHGRALLGIPEGPVRLEAWQRVVRLGLSVRETEALARRPASKPKDSTAPRRRNSSVSDLEGRLRRALSTRVTVTPRGEGARIIIECYSAEELDSVIGHLLGENE